MRSVADTHSDSYTHTDCNSNSYSSRQSDADTYFETQCVTAASSDAAASVVARKVDSRELIALKAR